jgi:site-specific DNA-cytosine methylase
VNGLALCSGYGGLEIALEICLADYRTVCYVEREAYPVAITIDKMEKNILAPAPIWDDLTLFDGLPWRGKVHIVTAGFPCQPFSCAGQQKGDKDERFIWPEIARIICEVEPALVFLENVPGLLAMPREFGRVLGDLAEAGFDAEWGVFSAAEIGASHQRKRLFIFGMDNTTTGKRKGFKKTIRTGQQRISTKPSRELADAPKQQVGAAGLAREGSAWPTPRSSPNENRTMKPAPTHGKSHGKTLAGEAANWPTPATRDHKSDKEIKPDSEQYGTKGKPLPRAILSFLPALQTGG